jgi:hypothetical protein
MDQLLDLRLGINDLVLDTRFELFVRQEGADFKLLAQWLDEDAKMAQMCLQKELDAFGELVGKQAEKAIIKMEDKAKKEKRKMANDGNGTLLQVLKQSIGSKPRSSLETVFNNFVAQRHLPQGFSSFLHPRPSLEMVFNNFVAQRHLPQGFSPFLHKHLLLARTTDVSQLRENDWMASEGQQIGQPLEEETQSKMVNDFLDELEETRRSMNEAFMREMSIRNENMPKASP